MSNPDCQYCDQPVEYVTFQDGTRGWRHVGDDDHTSGNQILSECPKS